MSTDHIVSLLIVERDRLNRAIETLSGSVKGRPVKTSLGVAPTPQKATGWSPAQKAAQAKRMKAYWAKKKRVAKV